MKRLKQKVLLVVIGSLILTGCASTPMKELKPEEMIVSINKNKYLEMKSPKGLQEWEKGLWEYQHKHYSKAQKILEPYKNKNISAIQHAYGNMYQNGLGDFKKDYKKAAMFYQKAIEIDNYSSSLNNLGTLYYYGLGVSKDKDKAIELYKKAAKGGDMYCQFYLADNYHFGRDGFSEDYGKAYYWYQQASNQGHAKAARRIGYMYENGNGFKPNYEKAFYWHKLAAKRGNKNSKGDMIRLKSILYKKNKNR